MTIKNPLILNASPANTIVIEPIKMTDAVDFGKSDHTAAVRPAIPLDSRESLRKYIRNAAKAVTPLQEVVDDFAKYVKIAPKEITYGEIYAHFLNYFLIKSVNDSGNHVCRTTRTPSSSLPHHYRSRRIAPTCNFVLRKMVFNG